MVQVLHPSGSTFVRALLTGLQSRGTDYRFLTTIACGTNRITAMMPARVRSQVLRRSYPIPRSRIHTRSVREWVRLLSPLVGLGFLSRHEAGWASVDAVYRDLDQWSASQLRERGCRENNDDWVYAYEDGALASFQAAAEAGVNRAYDLPIAYWRTSRRLLEEEVERWPEWAATLVGTSDSQEKLERKSQELDLAQLIVVPSRFVQRSLPETLKRDQRVIVAEFGSPLPGAGLQDAVRNKGSKLRLLFAGSMTQRKGLADLFDAIKLLRRTDVELVVMGSLVAPLSFYQNQGVKFTYEPPRPHADVLALMRSCDVLVLPSIVEGRALVQQEAMACGLPILVTANAGGEDLVLEGETGFVVPVRCPRELAEKIDWLADHRADLPDMGRAAQKKASEYVWSGYASKIINALTATPG